MDHWKVSRRAFGIDMREIECIFANANYMSWPIAARQIQHVIGLLTQMHATLLKKKLSTCKM